MKILYLAIAFMVTGLVSCNEGNKSYHENNDFGKEYHEKHDEAQHGHNHANKHMHESSVKDLIKSFESEERAITQKPYDVIALFGDLKGKKILDIGSGSGYFTFRLAEKGANVIAGDVNDEFHDYIKGRMAENDVFMERIEIRKLPYDSPALENNEVDGVIIVNTYHHIEDRIAYFGKVNDGLNEDGMLLVVDFMKIKFKEKVDGPPYEMRLSYSVIVNELKQAGFNRIEVDNELLPYQYIVKAWKE